MSWGVKREISLPKRLEASPIRRFSEVEFDGARDVETSVRDLSPGKAIPTRIHFAHSSFGSRLSKAVIASFGEVAPSSSARIWSMIGVSMPWVRAHSCAL